MVGRVEGDLFLLADQLRDLLPLCLELHVPHQRLLLHRLDLLPQRLLNRHPVRLGLHLGPHLPLHGEHRSRARAALREQHVLQMLAEIHGVVVPFGMRLLALELLADEQQHVDHVDATHLNGLVLAHLAQQPLRLQGVDLHDECREELLLRAVGDGAAEALGEELVQVVGGVIALLARQCVLLGSCRRSIWQLSAFSTRGGSRLGIRKRLLLQLLLLLLEFLRLLLLPLLPLALCRRIGRLLLRCPPARILVPRALVLGSLVAALVDPSRTIPGGLGAAPHRCRAAWTRALRRTRRLLRGRARRRRLLCCRGLHFHRLLHLDRRRDGPGLRRCSHFDGLHSSGLHDDGGLHDDVGLRRLVHGLR
mmetsp:Transcript_29655/g.69919  ORF Transcript_29655/g.69919 Transcript_29655/m.69919 type:complete len:364 (-) Transcript_29655:36-1127(-)